MVDQLPEPLTTPADDVRGLDGFMLNAQRLLSSELWALATGDEFKAAVGLWCRAWEQVPAGSLPDDDRLLAAFSGAGTRWRRVKEMALRGFVKCSDGRLYNRTLCEDVKRAAAIRVERRERTKAATEARKAKRGEQRDDGNHDQRDVPEKPNVTTTQDKTRQDKTEEIDSALPRTRDDLAILEGRLREAAGWQNEPSPGLFVTGPIQALISAGADLDLDVLPTIRAKAPKITKPRSWNYFIDPIVEARDTRIRAATIVSPPGGPDERHRKPHRTSGHDLLLAGVYGQGFQGDGQAG